MMFEFVLNTLRKISAARTLRLDGWTQETQTDKMAAALALPGKNTDEYDVG